MVIKHYNSKMGGVDHADMLCALYGHDRQLKKWWHRLFFGMMDITLVNSVKVYCELVKKISLLDFTISIVGELLAHKSVSKKSVHRQQVVALDAALANRRSHCTQFSDKRGRCPECAKNKRESRPFSYCSFCKVHISCNSTYNCFASYHGISPKKTSN